MLRSFLLASALYLLCIASENHAESVKVNYSEDEQQSKHSQILANNENSADENIHLAESRSSGPTCKYNFEGFGVHLGSIGQLELATPQLIDEVADKLYNDLHLRRFRTSYEQFFSTAEDEYDISCKNNTNSTWTCTWQLMHRAMSKYPDATYMASIWSPPYYMKNEYKGLKTEYETKFYYFIKNITELIKKELNQTIELVSLVNEPENFVVTWDHCNMGPDQICRMVEDFNDPLVSGCTENAWYSVTKVYMDFNTSDINCRRACKTVLTHAYAVNFNFTSPDFMLASYDKNEYTSKFEQPIWLTEVSSTYGNADVHQMEEAVELSRNIIHFVGTTCVSRYYFWLAFTSGSSGESLIWGDTTKQELTFPKKYFAYRHFTTAAFEHTNATIQRCDDKFTVPCLKFNNQITKEATAVFIVEMKGEVLVQSLKICSQVCCTSEEKDNQCGYESMELIPSPSVCSCKIKTTAAENITATVKNTKTENSDIITSLAKSIFKPGASILTSVLFPFFNIIVSAF